MPAPRLAREAILTTAQPGLRTAPVNLHLQGFPACARGGDVDDLREVCVPGGGAGRRVRWESGEQPDPVHDPGGSYDHCRPHGLVDLLSWEGVWDRVERGQLLSPGREGHEDADDG